MGSQAFSGKRLNGFMFDPDDLVLIGLDTDDGEEHPLYDPRVRLPVDDALARDIAINGVLQPVKVRKNGDVAEVVLGRQRVKAARLANTRLRQAGKEPVMVPFLVHRAADDRDFFGVAISENEHRRADDPMEKATKAARLEAMGMTVEEIAIRFGVGKQTIGNWLALLDTSAQVRKAVRAGKVSATAAAKLAKLPRDEQNAALDEMIEAGNTTVNAAAQRAKGSEPKSRRPSIKVVRALYENRETLEKETRDVLGWIVGERKPPASVSRILRDL